MKKLRLSNRAIIGTGLVLCVLVAIIVAWLLGLVDGQAAAIPRSEPWN